MKTLFLVLLLLVTSFSQSTKKLSSDNLPAHLGNSTIGGLVATTYADINTDLYLNPDEGGYVFYARVYSDVEFGNTSGTYYPVYFQELLNSGKPSPGGTPICYDGSTGEALDCPSLTSFTISVDGGSYPVTVFSGTNTSSTSGSDIISELISTGTGTSEYLRLYSSTDDKHVTIGQDANSGYDFEVTMADGLGSSIAMALHQDLSATLTGPLTITGLSGGEGDYFVCVDYTGLLYRNAAPCVGF